MRRARQFLGLSAPDRWLLASAFLAVAWVRIRLLVLRFRVGRGYRMGRRGVSPPSPEQIAWAVDRAAHHLGKATCLVRAVAAQLLLARHGYPANIHIGVAAGTNFTAHAWVDCGGRVLIGGPDVQAFTPLFAWGNDAAR